MENPSGLSRPVARGRRGAWRLLGGVLLSGACSRSAPPPPSEPLWQGFQQAPVSLAAGGGQVRALRAADVNGDGGTDLVLVASREAQVRILEGDGKGGFAAARPVAAGTTPMDVAVSDLNRDGHADLLVVGHFSNSLTVFLGRGEGVFSDGVPYPLGNHSQQVRLADLDGDGLLDAMTKNAGSAGYFNVTLLAGRGDGTFGAASPYSVTGLPRDMVIADVSSDGLPDVLVLNTNSFTVDVLAGRRGGAPASLPPVQLGGAEEDEPYRLAALDVDGDDRVDLVITHGAASPGYLSVHLGRGDGGFTAAARHPAEAPGELATADFNRDGRTDLAYASLAGGVFVLTGGEGGSFGPLMHVASGAPPTSLLAADLDGDGFPDLAWTTQDTVELLFSAVEEAPPSRP